MVYPPMFIIHAVLFAFALVMTARSFVYWKCNELAIYFIMAAFSLISLFLQLRWSGINSIVGFH